MNPIEKLRGQVANVWNQMEAIMARSTDESRSMNDDERTEWDTLEVQLRSDKADLARMEAHERHTAASSTAADQTPDDLHPQASARPRSLGEHFVNSVGEQIGAARNEGSRFTVSAPEFRNAAADTVTTGGNDGDLSQVLTDVDTSIVDGPRRRFTIEDLLDSGAISGQAITYFVEGAFEGDFTTVAEGAQKPQFNVVNPTPVTEALKKIAGFIKESDELIEDLPFLASAINNRLLYRLDLFTENQILNGNGTGTNLKGLLNRSGIQTLGADTDLKADNADKLFEAITKVSTGAELEADGIVINPVDYMAFRLQKDANKQYMGGGFFAGPYGNGAVEQELPIWAKRTVVTSAIAAGTVLVGSFRQAATVYTKGGTRVEATNSDTNDFTNNRVTIRAERRKALAVRRPSGLVKVTLGDA